MAVSPGALCLSLVLCVCGVGCGAAEPNLTASDALLRLRHTPTPTPVPVDQLNTVNYNSSDHENHYSLELYGHYTTANLPTAPLFAPPLAEDGEDTEGLPNSNTQRESRGNSFISFSKDKNDTVLGRQRDTLHSRENSLLLDTESTSNISSPYFSDTVQSVSPLDHAGTPLSPGQQISHNADQVSRNTSSGFNSVQNRTHEGDVRHIDSERPPVSLSGTTAGVADPLDHFRSSRKDSYSHNSDSLHEVASVPPPSLGQRLCVVTQLPLAPSSLPQDNPSNPMHSTGVRHGSTGAPGGEEEGESLVRYTVTCDASVSLNNLSAVAEVTYKRHTISL